MSHVSVADLPVRHSRIDLEIVTESLISIVREMRQTVFRTAHSPVIADAQDFSCALFTPAGEMVAQGRDMPGHVIAMPASLAEILAEFGDDMQPGDVYVVNDPYRGGSHLNDVTLMTPVFVDGSPFLFPCVRMHWADIGGMTPGSVSGQATEIFQEGLRIPPVRLMLEGEVNETAMTLIFANVRMSDERRGDLESNIAACRTAERRLRELADRHTPGRVRDCIAHNMNRTEARLRDQIEALPDGTYLYEDYLDLYTDGEYDPALVRCALTIDGSELIADFRGSSDQVAAVVNSTLAMTTAGVFIAVKSALDPGGLVNHGAFRPLKVVTTPGSVVDLTYPAPANAHSEVRKRVISVTMAALSQIAADRVAADQFGTTFQNLLGGIDGRTDRPYLYYDYPTGGNGGFAESDGPSAMNPVDLGDISTIQSVERLESETPVLITECELRVDSGGAGLRRGGLGAARSVRLLATHGSYSVQADRTTVPPYGLGGGHSGTPACTAMLGDDGRLGFATPGKVAGHAMRAGETLVMEAAGGGGWGDPLDRSVTEVESDVSEGYVSRGQARESYGVVFDAAAAVDAQATKAQREALRRARRYVPVISVDRPPYEGRRGRHRIAYLPPVLPFPEGSLVELLGRHPAPLRAWVRHDASMAEGIGLDEAALLILGVEDGGAALVRLVPG